MKRITPMAFANVFENVTSRRNATVPKIVVQSTDVGYEVRTQTPFGDRAVLIERVSAIAGLGLIAFAVAGLYVGRAYHVNGLGAGHMAAGAVLLTGGVAYIWISARGMRHQANFDLGKRELHYVVRNRLNTTRVLRTVGFDEIADAFIQPASKPGKPAKLFVRVGNADDLIEVARGSMDDLEPLHARLSQDLPKK